MMTAPENDQVDPERTELLPDRDHQLAYPTSGTREEVDGEEPKEDEDEDMASWAGQPAIKGSSETMRMALLTFSLIGLQ